jgi:hypothetical protein
VVQSAISLADRHPAAPAVSATVAEVRNDLLELFGLVPDGRSGQGRDHPVAAVLALAAAAVVAGMKGYTAIAGWVKDVPPPVLADLYMRAGASPARPPSKATIWRVVTDADAEVFDATVGRWLVRCQATGQEDGAGGRITTRTIQVMPAPEDLPFPHVRQVLLIERYVSDMAGKPLSAVAALGVASPGPDRASPADLARYVRGQWAIESLHWLRDTLYQEDKSQVRTRSGPRIMAALRNLAISALRLAGRTDITDMGASPAERHHRAGRTEPEVPCRTAAHGNGVPYRAPQ